MQILILEGIATSGKSTVTSMLNEALSKEIRIKIFPEEVTHIPIIDKTSELCLEHFENLVNDATSGDYDLAIFDRLYLTQAVRSKSSLAEYISLETILLANICTTVLLTVEDSEIGNRIEAAQLHRPAEWGSYVATKGTSKEDQAGYYIVQQSRLLATLQGSKLPFVTHDTSKHQYDQIVAELKKKVLSDRVYS